MKKLSIASVMLFFFVLSGSIVHAKTKYITICTGGISGIYYPTGGVIAMFVNDQSDNLNIVATVETTKGSVYNINAVLKGDCEFGLAQSDRQYQAMNGLDEWESNGAQGDLRAIFSLYPEAVTLVVGADSNISDLEGLKGKRVNIGNFGAGFRQNAIDVLSAAGVDYQKDIVAESITPSVACDLFHTEFIDAYFYTIGHPAEAMSVSSTGPRKIKFVPITNIDGLLKEKPYYAPTKITTSYYPGIQNKKSVPTIGVMATLITSAKVDDDVVYALTKQVFENLDRFRAINPVYEGLTKQEMLTGLVAPIHPGAMKYYKEVGLK